MRSCFFFLNCFSHHSMMNSGRKMSCFSCCLKNDYCRLHSSDCCGLNFFPNHRPHYLCHHARPCPPLQLFSGLPPGAYRQSLSWIFLFRCCDHCHNLRPRHICGGRGYYSRHHHLRPHNPCPHTRHLHHSYCCDDGYHTHHRHYICSRCDGFAVHHHYTCYLDYTRHCGLCHYSHHLHTDYHFLLHLCACC